MDAHFFSTSVAVTLVAQIIMAMLLCATLMTLARIFKGPTMTDRVVALDFLTFIVVSFIGVLAIFKQDARFLDVSIVLALVAFLATIAYARYIERITQAMDMRNAPPEASSDAHGGNHE